ncbi:MAG: hypothetical protein ACRD98_03625 [Nitrososphaera sp.]
MATQLTSQLTRVFLDSVRTASGQAVILPTQSALTEGYREAKEQARFGEQMLPSPAAMREANELLAVLPQWCVAPNPTIEPSGSIAFEWDMGPNRWLVLALRGTGTIEYSAVLGFGNERWGTTNFAGNLGRHELVLLTELMHLKG